MQASEFLKGICQEIIQTLILPKQKNQLVLVIAEISGYTDPWSYFLARHLSSS